MGSGCGVSVPGSSRPTEIGTQSPTPHLLASRRSRSRRRSTAPAQRQPSGHWSSQQSHDDLRRPMQRVTREVELEGWLAHHGVAIHTLAARMDG